VKRVAISGTAPADLLRRTGEAFVKFLPSSRYTLGPGSASDDAVTLEVDVTELGRSPVAWQHAPAAHGTVSLTVIAGDARRSLSARFQEKPWADDFAAFTNANPAGAWVVGRTARPWGSQAEASADALSSAAEALAPVVQGQLKGATRKRASDGGRLRQIIVEDLQTGRLIADRFTQRFARPYGDVWNEAVLVDAAPDKLKSISERYAHEARGREVQKGRAFAAAGGLLVGLSVIYLFLNALTKGYFTWRLRAVTLLLAAVGLFIVKVVASS
jgi:hypothetical protein